MLQKLRPLADRVWVKRRDAEQTTASGLIIPDAAKEKAQTGIVLAVGSGRKDPSGKSIPMDVAVGDLVYFGKYAGTEAGTDCLIIREDEILGVVEK